MKEILGFLPDIPDDVRKARLGQGFDSLTGKLKENGEIFRLDKMKKASFTDYTTGTLVSTYQVDRSSSEVASNSFSSTAAQAETSFWRVSASVSASMDKEQEQANSSFEENIVLQSIHSGYFMNFRSITAMTDKIYSCTFGSFRLFYDRIMKASNIAEYNIAYESFEKAYGDSCVTRVHLVAGSAFQITVKQTGSSVSKQAKYGASTSVTTPFGGASAAGDWGSGMSEKHSNGSMNCSVVHYPSDTPTYQFVHAEFEKRVEQGFNNLARDPLPDPERAPKTPVVAPDIKEYKGPDEEVEVPKQELSNDKIKEADDEKELKLAREGGHEGTLEEYRKDKRLQIEDLQDNTTKTNGGSNVANEASDVLKARENANSNGQSYYDILGVTRTATRSEIDSAYRREALLVHPDKHKGDPVAHAKFIELKRIVDTLRDPVKRKLYDEGYNNKNRISTPAVADNKMSLQQQREVTENTNSWDLGGFLVNSYETTKWTKLFPQLKRTFPLDDSPIYVVRFWLYYLTRLELLQYLRFQIDVGDDGATTLPGRVNLINLKNDANLFSELCDDLRKEIEAALNKPDFSQVDYLEQILAFDDELRITNRFRFASMKVYDTFFEHYDLFHNNPLGFVRVQFGGTVTYFRSNGGTTAVDGLRLPALLTDANRYYPFIFADGRSAMVCYYVHMQGFWFESSSDFFRLYRKEPNGGTLGWEAYSSIDPLWDVPQTFYGVNYDDLDTNGGKMFGVPFLSRLPFDKIVLPLHSTGA
eukprot:CAMPEP_0170856910 /NCGR_PEP_ID=MMETSP0734-20130129/14917_1 /TAXON_ID=186038 /ORGANISM="Fragilariopsis kerguelensis, Strain L26-C5" /LENGTH=757 /DNA_ID=CAMNT_0011228925 /DNA_START=228 /DNA_END=2501 /DNA_ORIENTATION=-